MSTWEVEEGIEDDVSVIVKCKIEGIGHGDAPEMKVMNGGQSEKHQCQFAGDAEWVKRNEHRIAKPFQKRNLHSDFLTQKEFVITYRECRRAQRGCSKRRSGS